MNWHDYIAMGLVYLALHFVVKRVVAAWFGHAKPGCGSGCGTCSNVVAKKPPDLLAIDPAPVQRSP
jgi:hypothetical protein